MKGSKVFRAVVRDATGSILYIREGRKRAVVIHDTLALFKLCANDILAGKQREPERTAATWHLETHAKFEGE